MLDKQDFMESSFFKVQKVLAVALINPCWESEQLIINLMFALIG